MPYKAFNKDFTCKGKQYEENTTYGENGNEICEAGVMHYCENPFDVLDYYPIVNENGEISEFAEVEPLGEVFTKENKSATNKIHIKAKLGLKGFVKACVDFTIEKTKIDKNEGCVENDNGNIPQRLAVVDIPQRLAVVEITQRLHQRAIIRLLWQQDITLLQEPKKVVG